MNRLYRSPDDRILAGVAGGLAEMYDLDPALVRVGWVFLMLITGGIFLLIYIVMAIVVPLRPSNTTLWNAAGTQAPPVAPPGPEPSGGVGPMAGQPTPPNYYPRRQRREHRDGSAGLVFGSILVIVGGYFLFRSYIPALDWDLIWPLIVIGGGALLIVAAMSRPRSIS